MLLKRIFDDLFLLPRCCAAVLGIVVCLGPALYAEYNPEVQLLSLLKTDTTSIGQPIHYPKSEKCQTSIIQVTIPPGKETGWHKHEFPVFAYILKGTLTVEFEGHPSHQFVSGSCFAEAIDVFHNGRNDENEDLIIIALFAGEKGKPLSVKKIP